MLSGKQKSYLRGLAHTMQPIVQVGKNGVNETLVKQVDDILEARELFKISVLQNCLEEPKDVAAELGFELDAEIIQVIGRTIIIYRQSRKKKKIELPR
ncbi:MAG TPA: ribosome assembly RNA-binding protein YhbY [Firmicutes bacterium]|nr:ribosome assembly RNA-binding protein YhbY [Bacillota bacterium]